MLIANFFSFMLYISDFKISCWIQVKLYRSNHFWMNLMFSAFFWFWLRLQLYWVLNSECQHRKLKYQLYSRNFWLLLVFISCLIMNFSWAIHEGHSQTVIVLIHWIRASFSCTDSCCWVVWKAFADRLSFHWACRIDWDRL